MAISALGSLVTIIGPLIGAYATYNQAEKEYKSKLEHDRVMTKLQWWTLGANVVAPIAGATTGFLVENIPKLASSCVDLSFTALKAIGTQGGNFIKLCMTKPDQVQWIQYFTDDNIDYYHNHKTGKTVWTLPNDLTPSEINNIPYGGKYDGINPPKEAPPADKVKLPIPFNGHAIYNSKGTAERKQQVEIFSLLEQAEKIKEAQRRVQAATEALNSQGSPSMPSPKPRLAGLPGKKGGKYNRSKLSKKKVNKKHISKIRCI
jgi:hypothetical protein